MKSKSFEITSDCLNITGRLKEIDKDYFIMYNLSKEKFELHNRAQRNTYCLTFPYDALDERAIFLTLKTRVQNSDELFAEMESENEKLRKRQVAEVLNGFKEKIYDS